MADTVSPAIVPLTLTAVPVKSDQPATNEAATVPTTINGTAAREPKDAPMAPAGFKLVKVRKPDGTIVTVKRPIDATTKPTVASGLSASPAAASPAKDAASTSATTVSTTTGKPTAETSIQDKSTAVPPVVSDKVNVDLAAKSQDKAVQNAPATPTHKDVADSAAAAKASTTGAPSAAPAGTKWHEKITAEHVTKAAGLLSLANIDKVLTTADALASGDLEKIHQVAAASAAKKVEAATKDAQPEVKRDEVKNDNAKKNELNEKDATKAEGFKLVKVRKPDGTIVTVKRPIEGPAKKPPQRAVAADPATIVVLQAAGVPVTSMKTGAETAGTFKKNQQAASTASDASKTISAAAASTPVILVDQRAPAAAKPATKPATEPAASGHVISLPATGVQKAIVQPVATSASPAGVILVDQKPLPTAPASGIEAPKPRVTAGTPISGTNQTSSAAVSRGTVPAASTPKPPTVSPASLATGTAPNTTTTNAPAAAPKVATPATKPSIMSPASAVAQPASSRAAVVNTPSAGATTSRTKPAPTESGKATGLGQIPTQLVNPVRALPSSTPLPARTFTGNAAPARSQPVPGQSTTTQGPPVQASSTVPKPLTRASVPVSHPPAPGRPQVLRPNPVQNQMSAIPSLISNAPRDTQAIHDTGVAGSMGHLSHSGLVGAIGAGTALAGATAILAGTSETQDNAANHPRSVPSPAAPNPTHALQPSVTPSDAIAGAGEHDHANHTPPGDAGVASTHTRNVAAASDLATNGHNPVDEGSIQDYDPAVDEIVEDDEGADHHTGAYESHAVDDAEIEDYNPEVDQVVDEDEAAPLSHKHAATHSLDRDNHIEQYDATQDEEVEEYDPAQDEEMEGYDEAHDEARDEVYEDYNPEEDEAIEDYNPHEDEEIEEWNPEEDQDYEELEAGDEDVHDQYNGTEEHHDPSGDQYAHTEQHVQHEEVGEHEHGEADEEVHEMDHDAVDEDLDVEDDNDVEYNQDEDYE